MNRNRLIYLITILSGIIFIFIGHSMAGESKFYNENVGDFGVEKVEVISITKGNDLTTFEFIFLEKDDKNTHTGTLDHNVNSNVSIKIGDNILVTKVSEGSDEYSFYDYVRINYLFILIGVFLAFVVLFGHKKGVNTVISLVFTVTAIAAVFLPAVLAAKNIYFWGFITCLAILIFSLIVVHGFNRKSLTSGLGTILGLVFAWLIMIIAHHFLNFSGLTSDDAMYLKFNSQGLEIDILALFFTSIIIGALGAVMDVAMSIASSLQEIKNLQPLASKKEMYKAGLEIGRDIMGAMTNTLILAYIGSGLVTLLVVLAFNTDLYQMFNREFLVAQIFEPLIGSFGIVAALPLTSLIGAYLIIKDKK